MLCDIFSGIMKKAGGAKRVEYRKAGPEDLETLVESRMMVLRAANGLGPDADMEQVEQESRAYYEKALTDGSHAAWLAWENGKIVGCGGVSFYQVMPTYHNPTGWKAYIMNMYTDPAHRRQGIAREMLRRLIQEAHDRGIRAISLEATRMGRPLYEACGFVKMDSEMYLPETK